MNQQQEMVCPKCRTERADYEGPNGAWLPKCPNCGSDRDPVVFEVEDDPGELVEIIVQLAAEMRDSSAAKQQLREALVKLIDERIQASKH